MGYKMTLEKAGAEVLAFKEFGSYQGTWLALVKYNNQYGIIEGSYGSCSGCDSFLAEFDNYDEKVEYDEKTGKYYRGYYFDGNNEITKEEANKANLDLDKRYCQFGKNYLNDIQPEFLIQQRLDVINSKKDQDDWFDNETKEYLEWALEQFKICNNK